MVTVSRKHLFCLVIGLLSTIKLFASPISSFATKHNQSEKIQPTVNNIFVPYTVKPGLLGASGGRITLTGTGTIRFLQAFFYSDVACSAILGIASVIDNSSQAFTFTNGQTVSMNDSVTFTLADNQNITTGNIACMKLFWNGSNESPDGVSCQSFNDMSCSGSTCTSSQIKSVSWGADPTACAQRYAYITDTTDGSVTQCEVSASNGDLTNCGTTGGSFTQPTEVGLNNGHAYITSLSAETVTECDVNDSNGNLTCSSPTAITAPIGLALNTGYIYITAGTTSINKCSVAADGGALSSCGVASTDFTDPHSLAINNGYLYGTQINPVVITKCLISSSDGTLSGCGPAGSVSGKQRGIAINNGFAYIVVRTNSRVERCTISGVDGTFVPDSCTSVGEGSFSSPTGITISNGFAYVTNSGNGTVTKCTVGSGGDLTSCATTVSGFSDPQGIAIY
ncbi:MAG: hypothetical protein NXI01_08735 [Gammaproteobacteria bacterium]|nr:hypothetical protein [Gammaproteobacteria bacterium]